MDNLEVFGRIAEIQGLQVSGLEVLGEKAFPEGHVDLLIKRRVPIGIDSKAVVEVKLKRASRNHVTQLREYMDQLGSECAGGVLVAADFGNRIAKLASDQGIACVRYELRRFGERPVPAETLLGSVMLTRVAS